MLELVAAELLWLAVLVVDAALAAVLDASAASTTSTASQSS